MKTIPYDYETFYKDVRKLAGKIKRSGVKYEYIVAIARGGLVPGTVLSHLLNTRLTTLTWSTRDSGDKDYNLWIPELINEKHNILVVDDIIDSGECLSSLIKDWTTACNGHLSMENLHIACLIYNKDQSIIPDYYVNKISRKQTPEWFDFWWEKKK